MTSKSSKLSRKIFEKELGKVQEELCHLQEHVKKEGMRIIVIFEGRDAAGKGGVIKRITDALAGLVEGSLINANR